MGIVILILSFLADEGYIESFRYLNQFFLQVPFV